jgi:hypothetical protein
MVKKAKADTGRLFEFNKLAIYQEQKPPNLNRYRLMPTTSTA